MCQLGQVQFVHIENDLWILNILCQIFKNGVIKTDRVALLQAFKSVLNSPLSQSKMTLHVSLENIQDNEKQFLKIFPSHNVKTILHPF